MEYFFRVGRIVQSPIGMNLKVIYFILFSLQKVIVYQVKPTEKIIKQLFIHFNRFEDKQEMIESTLSEIFIRDVLGDLARLQRQEIVIRDILKGILEKYGSRYSFSKLSNAVGRTHVTVIDSLEILKDSFILFILYAYEFSKRDIRLKGFKKVYFLDPFIYHSLKSYLSGEETWDIIYKTLIDENIQSMIVEGVVLSHLLMHGEIPYSREGKTFLWYHYDRSGKEIDAVTKVNDKYLGIEVKYHPKNGKVKYSLLLIADN